MAKIITARTSGVAPHIPVVEELNVTQNGTYTATSGVDGYSPVNVNVQPTLITKNITANGTYNASSDNADGYSQVVVDVQEQPWQPLEDGYSNFWFELTDDTLSPWLNFSAKNNDAVIDWGDGSGEVALDTLTPTHTYSKAGKHIVKVKGVTGIAAQLTSPYRHKYMSILKAVELNSDVTAFVTYAFARCVGLKNVDLKNTSITGNLYFAFVNDGALQSAVLPSNITSLNSTFYQCLSINDVEIPSQVTSILSAFYTCLGLTHITIPTNVAEIGANSFSGCSSLSEVHVQATNPPTLGNNVFNNLPANYVIYVPVGTLAAYQSAWSAYADHIVEEGGQLTRAQLRNIANEAKKNDTGDDMR